MANKVKVLVEFVDRDSFTLRHLPGEIIETFDDARIANLVERGIVEVVGESDNVTIDGVDLSKSAPAIVDEVNASDDVEKLYAALDAENASKNPRVSVTRAIEARIENLTTRGYTEE